MGPRALRHTVAAYAAGAACAALAAGCGAGAPAPRIPRATPVAQARCLGGPAPPGPKPLPLLLAIDDSLSGCPASGHVARLPSRSFPYLGIACGIANWAGCDRIRVGVHLARPALLVVVQVDGHLVSLSPPSDPGSDLWQGAVLGLGPRHGPLAVRARHGRWYGEPPVHPRLRVTAFFADGTSATHAGIGYLHAGYG